MTIAWHFRGYDRQSESVGVEFAISTTMLPIVRAFCRGRRTIPS